MDLRFLSTRELLRCLALARRRQRRLVKAEDLTRRIEAELERRRTRLLGRAFAQFGAVSIETSENDVDRRRRRGR